MKNKLKIILTIDYHRKNEVILMEFPFDRILMERVKKIGGFWSVSKKSWYLNHTSDNLKTIYDAFRGNVLIDDSALISQKNNPIAHYATTKFRKKHLKV